MKRAPKSRPLQRMKSKIEKGEMEIVSMGGVVEMETGKCGRKEVIREGYDLDVIIWNSPAVCVCEGNLLTDIEIHSL